MIRKPVMMACKEKMKKVIAICRGILVLCLRIFSGLAQTRLAGPAHVH